MSSELPRLSVLSVTGGHRVDLDAFRVMLDAVCGERGWRHAHAVQPAAQRWFDGDTPFDVIVCHDIPGLYLKRGDPPRAMEPEPWVIKAMERCFERGVGLVMLHHALAGWPTWDRWADALGGRFNYAPGALHGVGWPSSGTRITEYTAQVVAPEHPVCQGVEDFTLTDELYCCPIFEDRVTPLVQSSADFEPSLFTSTYEHVLLGEDAAPSSVGHPPVSNLIAWTTTAGASRIVTIQPGDSATTFSLAPYRRLLRNAIAWTGRST